MPQGAIVAWFAKAGPPPNGWALCNGNNGTPNLQNFFIRGAGSYADVTDIKQGNNKHMQHVGKLTTDAPINGANDNVKQENNQPLTAAGMDHKHEIQAFDTGPATEIPVEYKAMVYICRRAGP